MTTSYRIALVAAFPFISSCNNYLFEQKCPQQIKEQSIVAAAAEPTPADILFVVDNSGSMADEQENLAANFNAFIQEIAGAGDYQIMVVTTDTDSSMGERSGLQLTTFSGGTPSYATSFNSSGCVDMPDIQHGCARGPDAGRRIIKSGAMTPDDQIAAFQNNVRVGSCGSGTEKGLAGMINALQKTGPGQCNEGFLRPGANLVVIIVSDENDIDPNTPVDQYVNDLAAFKDFSKIRVAMIVGAVDGQAANCRVPNTNECGSLCMNRPPEGSGTSCTANAQCPSGEVCLSQRCTNAALQFWSDCNWCSFYDEPDCCSALNGSRYVDFARRVEARVSQQVGDRIPQTNCSGINMQGERVDIACLVDSICQENFSATLSRIARELIVTSAYNLTPAPVYPEGVVVKLKNGRFPADGLQLKYGDDFTISGTTLTLLGDKVPVQGEDIEIYYVVDTMSDAPLKGACGTAAP